MLAATQAYNLKMERDRVQSHITRLPDSLQKAAVQEHMGDLDRRVHRLAKTGLPEQTRAISEWNQSCGQRDRRMRRSSL